MPAIRVQELAAFVAEHQRMPRFSEEAERGLYAWVWRCRHGTVAMPRATRDRFDMLVAGTPKVAKPRNRSNVVAARRVRELADFVADYGRLPLPSGGGAERSLYCWVWRCRRGAVALPEQVRAEFDKLVAAYSGVRSVYNERTLREANEDRSRAAAGRTVDAARRAVASCRPAYTQVLRARVDYPGDTLQQLADRCAMSKDRYSALLRRALEAAARNG